jgi:tetratricopeptide (TPR) repeat protein
LDKNSTRSCDASTEAIPLLSADGVVAEPRSDLGKDSADACVASTEAAPLHPTDASAIVAAVDDDAVMALPEGPDISTAQAEVTDAADHIPGAEPQREVPAGSLAQAESSDDEPAKRVSVAAPALGPELPPAETEENTDKKDEKSLDQLLTEKLGETNNLLTNLRSNLTTVSLRVDNAIRMKEDANSQLKDGELDTALRLYLSSLWLLHPDDPPLPKALAKSDKLGGALLTKALECCFHDFSAKLPGKDDVSRGVVDRDTNQAETPEDEDAISMEDLLAKSAELRRGIYRNTARVCNELQEWATAKSACNFVLSVDAADIKALWLLAKAYDGESDLGQSISTLGKLLKADPNNRAARQMLDSLKKRKQREAAAYGGMFDRAGEQDYRRMYPQQEMRAKEEARKDAEGKLRLEDIAKLDPNNWAEHIGKLNAGGKAKAAFDGKECAKSMPNYSWMKHVLPTMNDEGKPQLDKLSV